MTSQGMNWAVLATSWRLTSVVSTQWYQIGRPLTSLVYHSGASLVATGAIITAGSNPQGQYAFQSDPSTGVYPTELRVAYYYPWGVPGVACEALTTAVRRVF